MLIFNICTYDIQHDIQYTIICKEVHYNLIRSNLFYTYIHTFQSFFKRLSQLQSKGDSGKYHVNIRMQQTV